MEEKGLKPLQEILGEFGGWPVVEGERMIYKFRRVGYSIDYLIDFSILPDPINSSVYTIVVIQITNRFILK